MKSLEELNAIKAEVTAFKEKLTTLTEEELAQVVGGGDLLTDNANQEAAHSCIKSAMRFLNMQNDNISEDLKTTIDSDLAQLIVETRSGNIINPNELITQVNNILSKLDRYTSRDANISKSCEMLRDALRYLKAMKA